MLQRFFDLRNEIVTFLKRKNAGIGIDELCDPDWLTDLAFPTDFTSHMNKLNLQLEGERQFINQTSWTRPFHWAIVTQIHVQS